MALKKSELYSSLWSSCDELRGGMDASQYKDYVLVLLFIKYISDRYAGVPYAPISIPEGASFKDMVALKGKPDIGDQINKKIIGPLANANKLSDFPDFNEPAKLGSGKEMVERLTNLIAIFENPALDFSKNRAEGDDILGDAYEYLMRHFATESGKSKGQFYTPAEVSRIIAQILGIRSARTSNDTTVYDPTCGSGSLLLKVADEARTKVTLYGQEKDAATSGLARMNMILHDNATASIVRDNTLANPKFTEGGTLKTFDYVVANPPFSDKRWSTGLDALHDPYERFQPFGTPPAKQGDYAYGLIDPPVDVRGVHLTRLTMDGGKAPIDKAKIMLGAMSGWPIVLAPVNDGLGLAITEGIEDGLSVFEETGLGVWAAGSAGNMPKIAAALPPYVECVTIFAHRDETGMRFAKEAARVIAATEVEVHLKGRG